LIKLSKKYLNMFYICNTMANILNIDASTSVLYVSISKDGKMIAEKMDAEQRNHASNLQPFVAEVLASSKLQFAELNAIAVMNGPGSYTGLRVGLAAAKGYCFALDIPLIPISNLSAMASTFYNEHPNEMRDVRCMMSPMKNELFCETYNRDLQIVEPAIHYVNDQKVSLLNSNDSIINIGSANDGNISNLLENDFLHILYNYLTINALSYKYFIHNEFSHISTTEPNYLKNTYVNT
jgi:tRNA threonylcarbamoyladenosine biosynthesis protein TsaB